MTSFRTTQVSKGHLSEPAFIVVVAQRRFSLIGGLRTRSIGWRLSEVQEWLDTRPRFDEHLYETMR